MRVRVAARSDIGRSRVRNEDAFLVNEPLYAVADGMGGHRGGDVASSLALEILQHEPGEQGTTTLEALVEQIRQANSRVLERGSSDRDLRGMGTTLTALLTDHGRAHVAHVGDSRAYRLRDGSLQQLTEDHTLVQRMVREGKLSEEEAAQHPQRNILTRVVGVEDELPVDQLTLDVREGDRLLLCTDGLTSMVERDRIEEILRTEADPQVACDRLIDAANRAGGEDNITVVVVDFVGDDAEVGASPPAREPKAAERAGPEPARDATVVGAAASEAAPQAKTGKRRWKRTAVVAAVVVAVVVAALIGVRVYVDRQWYVGVSDGRVAVFNGIPATVIGFKLSHVQETTDIDATQAERLQYWRGLDDGITADSFDQAQLIVVRIRQDVADSQPPVGGTG